VKKMKRFSFTLNAIVGSQSSYLPGVQ